MEFRLFVFGFEIESRKRLIFSQRPMGIAPCFSTDTDHETRLGAVTHACCRQALWRVDTDTFFNCAKLHALCLSAETSA